MYTFKEIKNNVWNCSVTSNLSLFIVMENSDKSFPANGGLRFFDYKDDQEALNDAYMLSRLMHQKHSIYNTGFCGAKVVANGKINGKNKKLLLEALGVFLNDLSGKIYTGCDLNTNLIDMEFLSQTTPYILSGLKTNIDTSSATAYGVYGSLQGIIGENLKKYSFLVHGIGKTGSVVSTLLAKAGARVYTYDSLKTIISGCNPVKTNEWIKLSVDCLVLCSSSGIINEKIAHDLNCRYIISGANNPFENSLVKNILDQKQIQWIPDPISNAGAVISDSVEFYNKNEFYKAEPEALYEFVRNAVYQKTILFNSLDLKNLSKEKALSTLSKFSSYDQLKCGMLFDLNSIGSSFHNHYVPSSLYGTKKAGSIAN